MVKLPTSSKVVSYHKLSKIRKQADKNKKKIVFASGCYDLTHLGHVAHFSHIKKWGDILVVSVANDENVRGLKGPNRPIMSETIRAEMVAALQVVDYVVISKESGIFDHLRILRLLRPDVYVGSMKDKYFAEKQKLAKSIGAKFITPSHKGIYRGGELLSVTMLEKNI